MEEKRDEILEKLYFLRAGLSNISKEKDEVISLYAKIDDRKQKEQKEYKELESIEKDIPYREKLIDQVKENVSALEYNIDNCKQQGREKSITVKMTKYFILAALLLSIGIVSAIWFGYVFWYDLPVVESWLLDLVLMVLFWVSPIIAIGSVVGIVVLIQIYISERKFEQKLREDLRKSSFNSLKMYENWKQEALASLEDNQKYLSDLKKRKKELEEKIQKKVGQEDNVDAIDEKSIENHIARGRTLFEVLYQEFSETHFLDWRDWESLDYVIYCFETGRAKDMREALHFVDMERRTNTIARAIEDAANRISQTIMFAVESLQQTITNETKRIVAKMDDIQQTVEANYQKLEALHLAELDKMDMLINAVDLNNALQEKAIINSRQLMSDVEKIRKNTDWAKEAKAKELALNSGIYMDLGLDLTDLL